VINPQNEMDVDMEIYKPQTDQEKIDHFNNVVMKNHRESLHQVDLKTFNDPLE
jgi:hypothetical protein